MSNRGSVGRKYLVPYLRLFPIWRYGPRSNLWGEPLDDGWYVDKYGTWEFETLKEAQAAHAAASH